MIRLMRIRLEPTKEQEELFRKSSGIARYSYNWGIEKWDEMYKNGEKPSGRKLRDRFVREVKPAEGNEWLYEVSSKVISQAFEDLQKNFNLFFERVSRRPGFKSRKKSRPSFYVRYDAINFQGHYVNFEKIGKVKFRTNYKIPKRDKYSDPRCVFDGKYWYLSIGFEQDENQVELNEDLSIGIDLGVTHLAVLSNRDQPVKNINKTKKVKVIEKKIHRIERRVARKYRMNNGNKQYKKTNNIIKDERKIKLLYRKLTNIRNNHLHQTTASIVKERPSRVVMEDINVVALMKNKYMAKAIMDAKWYEFKRQMKYKCEENGIEFVLADRFYPSSKTCSNCGKVKDHITLSMRTFKCDHCSFELDRDKNASINLSNYKSTETH